MLNIYGLTQAITESAAGVVGVDNIPAYNFIGGLDEATSEMNYILMAEAADLCAFRAGADEIMCEAAISNPESLEALSENVFQTVGAKVKAFIDKVIAMVKGMIEKIKAFFFKLTGKIDKWLTVMKPRITKASGYSGAGDQTVEIHAWDHAYVIDGGMVNGLAAIADGMTEKADGKFKAVEQAKTEIANVKADLMKDEYREKGGDDAGVKAAVDKINKELEALKDEKEETVEDIRRTIADAMGVDAANMDEMWAAVTKKATGGEKVTKKFSEAAGGKGVDGMLKAVEGSKKTISDLKKAYEKHLSDLNKLKGSIEKTFRADSKVEKIEKFPSELRGKYQTLVTEEINDATQMISVIESALNTAKSKHIGYVQQMTSEYMGALSKYANYKGKKSED